MTDMLEPALLRLLLLDSWLAVALGDYAADELAMVAAADWATPTAAWALL